MTDGTTEPSNGETSKEGARVRVAWKVKAIVSPNGPEIACVVLDVSTGGARLSIPMEAQLPDRFTLYIPLRDETHEVEVKWRDHDALEVGIAFVKPDGEPDAGGLPATDARIAQLEAQVQHQEEQLHKLEHRIATLMERVARIESP